MSGGKGTQQTGSSTATQTNPLTPYIKGAADYLTPYAQDPNRPYTAPPNPYQTQGYQNLADTGANLGGWPTARQYDAYGNLITGGGQSPAMPGYATLAAGGSGPQQTLDNVVGYGVNSALGYAGPTADFGNRAAALGQGYGSTIADYANQATGGNLGLSQLGDVASGKFTDAGSNPYLRDMVNAALRPVSENYQTSTAPTLDARFSAGGRYGSGAADQAAGSARDAFARNLGEISTGMYGKEYQFERGQQDTAAQQYDAARRAGLSLGITGNTAASEAARLGLATGISGNQAAGNLVDQGLRTVSAAANPNLLAQGAGLSGLDTGFRAGLTTQEQALRDYNNFATGQMVPAQADIQAGTGLRTLDQSMLQEPYDKVAAYLKAISGTGGTGGSSSTQPIFGNPLTSALSGATGVLGLGKELGLGGSGGLGGLGSAGGFLGSQGSLFGSLADASIAAGGPPLAADLTAAGAAGLEGLPIAASAGFWIVCTELMKQGKMRKSHYLAGWPVFAAYPERGRRGYYLWAIPLVRHLRKKPDSLLSRAAGAVFRWRAENIAAHAGVPGARKLWRGAAVTTVLYPLCAALGAITPPQDWEAVYREEQAACSP
jgi:hypothetical protein